MSLTDMDKSIIINGSFGNATELIANDPEFGELETYEDVAGAVAELANLIIEAKLEAHKKHGVSGGSGNSGRSSGRSSSSKKRASGSKKSPARKASGRGKGRKASGDGSPSDAQRDLYERVYEALDDDGYDLGDYPTPDELTFEEAKTDIGELMDEAKSRDLEF